MYKNVKRSGFTLVEIVVVMGILGVIMAFLYGGISRMRKNLNIRTTQLALKTVSQAIEQFRGDTGEYPRKFEDLQARPNDPKMAKGWVSPYIDVNKFPQDAWIHDLMYELKTKGSKPPYLLYSWGPSGEGSAEKEWVKFAE
ncbi:MAG: Type II secretory pathway [candidate division TM6 bacterium GW2011_GWE2_41_16]|nr:MAG: Type II secretory pathway [candidate division TM6 bacterium GW2011_GWE2_41_16]